MRFQNSVKDGCPICGKETTLAVIDPSHPDVGVCAELRRIGDMMESCRERLSSRRRRIAKKQQPRRLVRLVRKEVFHATTLPDLQPRARKRELRRFKAC